MQRSAAKAQSILPCTIKQLHSAKHNQTEDSFKIGDIELNQVCLKFSLEIKSDSVIL